MKRTHAISLYLSPLIIIVLVGLAWHFILKPQVVQLIRSQLPKINQAQDVVDLQFLSFDISLIKLQITVEDIDLNFKNGFQNIKPIHINNLKAQLDPFKLLVGEITFSKIQIHKLTGAFELKPGTTGPQPTLPTEALFNLLPQIPIERIFITASNFKIIDPKKNIDVNLGITNAMLTSQKNRLALLAPNIIINVSHEGNAAISTNLAIDATLFENHFDVRHFKLKSLDSYFEVAGRFLDIKNILIAPQAQLKFNSDINLENSRTIGLKFFPQKSRFPTLMGSVKSTGSVDIKNLDNVNGQITLQTTQVAIDHFKLGQAQVQMEVKKNQIFINQIEVEHPAGQATFNHIEIQQGSPYNFKAQLDVKAIDLQKLFLSLGLNSIPVGFIAKGHAECGGSLEPTLNLGCEVKTELKDIWVKPGLKDSFYIVKLKSAAIEGSLNASSTQLSYKSNLHIGNSAGSSSGQVVFAEGFNIDFESNKINFSDVESLGGLDLKGELKIKGSTSGDTNAGIIDADVTYSNAELEKFKLGALSSALSYEKGHLYLNQINGLIGQSKYAGAIDFNFLKSTLSANLTAPVLQAADVMQALQKRLDLPFAATGIGSGKVTLEGPFNFWKMSYDLTAQFKKGQIAEESYERLQVNLNANGERIQFNNVTLDKPRSQVVVDGFINTQAELPELNLKVRAQPLQIDDIDHLIRLAPAMTGQIAVEGLVSGNFDKPEFAFNFNAKQVNFENIEYPASQGRVVLDKKYFKFTGQLLGRQIQADLQWPWSLNDDFYLKMQIVDMNALVFLPLISLPQPNSDFYSRLNAQVDLKSPTRNFRQADGTIEISQFVLLRGAQSLKLVKPAALIFKKGLERMDPIDLKGSDSSLTVEMSSLKSDEARLTILADLPVRLFQFLVPFTQTLAGRLELISQVLLRNSGFELFGDGELTDGVVGFKGFPLPIDNINTPIEFSKSKVILSDISAQMGSAEIAGSGQIDIRGHKDIVVNLQAEADNIELTFPDQMTTAGRADIVFSGNWLPYTVKVDYKVSRGLIEKNFGESTPQTKTTLGASPFLPSQQAEQQTPSLLLDINIDIAQGVIVKNKLIEGEAVGTLKIYNTPENPLITGRIDIKPSSKLFFKDKPFDIQTATINFLAGKKINPNIYITANARVSDYDVNLLIQGPANNLIIKPTSQPPLSETDLISLLALGVTSSQMDQNLSSETQKTQTGLEVLAAISNQSTINKKIEEKLGLTVQLAPTVDSTKNIAVPKVVVSRKIRKNVNASFSRPLAGETQNQEWKLQYLFNRNKSMILNYQNRETNQQEQIHKTNDDNGILGLDFEYKKEFK